MIGLLARGLLLACTTAAVLLGAPSKSPACECLDRLWPWNWGRTSAVASATTYTPPYAGAPAAAVPAVNVSPGTPYATQTCSYVPQTCYRTVYQMTPVTTCQAVSYSDPCTGCPVTAYRPVTTYVRSAQLVPYTTYRVVWSGGYAPACSPCAGAVSSGCSSCGSSGTATPSYGGAASSSTLVPTPEPSTSSLPTPSLPAPSVSTAPLSRIVTMPLDAPAPAASTEPESRVVERRPLAPVPEKEEAAPAKTDTAPPKKETAPAGEETIKTNSLPGPRLIDTRDRTTALPVQRVGYVEVSRTAESGAGTPDHGGWRASRD